MFTKARWLAGAATTCILFSAAVVTTAQAADTIRLGLQSIPTDVLYQAEDWGKPYDLDATVSRFSSAGDSLKAFLAGQVDAVSGGSSRLVTMAAMQPEKFYFVAVDQYGGGRYGLIVAPDSKAKGIQDLKGKRIGVVAGSGSYGTFMLYLRKHGFAPSDFQLVNMKVEDIAAAVNHGVVDAGLAWEPQVAIAEVNHLVKRIDSMEGISESPNFILASRSYAKEHPEALARYIASLIDMTNLIKADPEKAGKLASQELAKSGVSIPPEAMTLVFGRIHVEPQIQMSLVNELVPIAESMKKAGRINNIPDFKSLVDDTYYNEAVKIVDKNS